nr:hypothetical protein [Tanacetum cinerariifolium]
MSSKAFRVFNKRTKRVEENLHVDFLENKLVEKGAGPNWLFDIDTLTNSMNYVPVVVIGTSSTNFSGTKDVASQDVKKDVSFLRYIALPNCGNSNPTATSNNPPADQIETLAVETAIPTVSSPVPTACLDDSLEPSNDTNGVEADLGNMEYNISASPTLTFRIHKDHPKSQIIGPMDTPVQTRTKSKQMEEQKKTKKISDALKDPSWVEAMQEELLQFKIQIVWSLVDCPKGVRPIGTKWVLKNKKDERGIDPEFLARVYKVEKAMYGLHQAPRAWYDDIIFGSSNLQLCREFEALMHEKFQMSAMGELNFFLGLQVLQKKDGIFLSQDKYVGDILKKFGYSDVRSANTPMDKENPWGKDKTSKDASSDT